MSLAISIVKIDPATGQKQVRLVTGPAGIAGVEDARTKLWGTEVVRSLGGRFLPTLADMNLLVEGEDLRRFRNEVDGLLANVDAIAHETGWDAAYISQLLANYRYAIDECIATGAAFVID